MKKTLLALLLASLLLLTGCTSPETLGMLKSKFVPDDTIIQSCQQSTGTNVHGRDVERSIGLDVELTEGFAVVTVRDQNSDIVFQTTVGETATLVVEVPEQGMYYVCLELHEFTGSYTIDWSN